MKSVLVPAYAKVNLCLDVLGQRRDGYHELRTIFQTITLHDMLALEVAPNSKIDLRVIGNSALAGETGRDNLVYRALDELRRELRVRQGIRAVLTKRIPVGRGLGGGSSDAAAALIAFLRLTGKRMEAARLVQIASRLGADVPFFLRGGRALGIGRGDEIYPLPNAPKQTIVVVSPRDIGVSTKDAFQWISAELTKRPEPPKIWGFCALCWSRQEEVSNDFEGPVFSRYPRLREIRDGLLKRGAADAALAGSGSAVFGIFRNPARARRAARAFPEDSVFVVETLSREDYGRALGWHADAHARPSVNG